MRVPSLLSANSSGSDPALILPVNFFRSDIDDAHAIRGFVRTGIIIVIVILALLFLKYRVALGIQLRRRLHRCAAQRHEHRLAIGAGVNTARPRYRDGGNDAEIGTIDDGDIAGLFIADVHLKDGAA